MSIKKLLVAAMLAAGVAGSAMAEATSNNGVGSNRLEGTWDLVLTFSDGSQVKSVLNVAAGRSANEGSIVHSAELSLVPPNPTLPEQGAGAGPDAVRSSHSYGFSTRRHSSPSAGSAGVTPYPDKNERPSRARLSSSDRRHGTVLSRQRADDGVRQRAEGRSRLPLDLTLHPHPYPRPLLVAYPATSSDDPPWATGQRTGRRPPSSAGPPDAVGSRIERTAVDDRPERSAGSALLRVEERSAP